MGKILTLSGGKEIEIYTNEHCPLCGKEAYQTVCCHFHEANVCYKHCGECRNFRKEFQQCVYKPLPKEIEKLMQRKNDREVRVPIAVPKQQIDLYKL